MDERIIKRSAHPGLYYVLTKRGINTYLEVFSKASEVPLANFLGLPVLYAIRIIKLCEEYLAGLDWNIKDAKGLTSAHHEAYKNLKRKLKINDDYKIEIK